MSMQKRQVHKRRRSSKILEERQNQWVKATLEKYAIYPATFYSWRKKYESMGEEAFTQWHDSWAIKRGSEGWKKRMTCSNRS